MCEIFHKKRGQSFGTTISWIQSSVNGQGCYPRFVGDMASVGSAAQDLIRSKRLSSPNSPSSDGDREDGAAGNLQVKWAFVNRV